MNENITRRYFVGNGIAAYFSGFFNKMFRKPRIVEASLPEPARVLDYKPTNPLPKSIELVDGSILTTEPDAKDITKVLAHPISREDDEKILFDEDGFLKDHICGGLDFAYDSESEKRLAIKFDEEISDEEFAAYQRWLNSDYPVVTSGDIGISDASVVTIAAESAPIGPTTDAREIEKPDSSGARAEVKRLPVPRVTDEIAAAIAA